MFCLNSSPYGTAVDKVSKSVLLGVPGGAGKTSLKSSASKTNVGKNSAAWLESGTSVWGEKGKGLFWMLG